MHVTSRRLTSSKTLGTASLMLSIVLSACGGGGGDSNSSTSSTTSSNVTGVMCPTSGSGTQTLSYTLTNPGSSPTTVNETLPYNYSWSCSSSTRSLSGNGVPNHVVTNGQLATRIAAQSVSFSAPFSPIQNSTPTNYNKQSPGYALNSVKFDPQTAGTCPSGATSASNCNYAGGTGFNMVAMQGNTSPWQFSFGVDTSNAHTQPSGAYHYHGVPTELINKLNTSVGTKMTLVGWANDGYPIYDQYGDSSAITGSTTLPNVTSGWTTKSTPVSGRPSTSSFAMGHFEEDWEFLGTVSGGLDRCNGHSGVTPEFPSGTYHYHLTETYPFVQRCVNGKIN
jgi:hypothetical protein